MRLHPAVTKDEALEWLTEQARVTWGEDRVPELKDNLESMADAMAAISAVELPDDVEPLFP
ncbi:MAG: hypothetical protein U5Q44_07630 [Dehalococcoidia bacterium]|nr:hypothetical protein [Dehalococcoidia bacterium]